MLIPWSSDDVRGTIWAVAHKSRETFDLDDYRLLNSLADFASIAIRHQRRDELLRKQNEARASAARAHELAHQINNPLQSLTNALYLAGHGGATEDYLRIASQELSALSELVQKLLGPAASD
jgi:nitrogen-specific signal transduction histidine kinase